MDFFGLTYGSQSNVRAMRYARASFLLDWTGAGGALIYVTTDDPDPFHPAWVKQLGRPLHRKLEQAPGVWQRQFRHGLVSVNTNSTPVRIRVGRSYSEVGATDALFTRTPRP